MTSLLHSKRRVRARREAALRRQQRALRRRHQGHHLWLEMEPVRRVVAKAWQDYAMRPKPGFWAAVDRIKNASRVLSVVVFLTLDGVV